MTTAKKSDKLNIAAPVDVLFEAVSKILSVVPVKSPKPVLANIKFSVHDGNLELSGTDLVAGIYYGIPSAVVADEGKGLLNGARLSELLKEFKGCDASLVFDPRGGCRFKAKGGNYKVVGDDPRDYPKTNRFDDAEGFEITGSDMLTMVKKTMFAAASEESQMTTNGVYLELKNGRFRMVATDNKRMSITEKQVSGKDFAVSVPREFLKAVIKATSRDLLEKTATVGVSGTKVFYRIATATVYGATLQGAYPPYEEALKIKLTRHIDCGVNNLLSTIRRAILVDKDLSAFNFTTGSLVLKSASSSIGQGVADMAIDFELEEEAEKIRVGFNPTYIKDGLEAMDAKRCRFYFQGPRSAGIFKELVTEDGVENESDRFIYAVMPALLPTEG